MHLASCLPFEQAARMLGDLLGVQMSAETVRRLSEQMGAWMDVASSKTLNPSLQQSHPFPPIRQYRSRV